MKPYLHNVLLVGGLALGGVEAMAEISPKYAVQDKDLSHEQIVQEDNPYVTLALGVAGISCLYFSRRETSE